MSKLTTKKLHLIKLMLCCCFLISYNFTNAQIEIEACLGQLVLLEGPSSLPPGPTACTQVTNVSISPMDDGIISKTEYGFWVYAVTAKTYTITSDTGPIDTDDNCNSQSQNTQFDIQIRNCISYDQIHYICSGDEITLHGLVFEELCYLCYSTEPGDPIGPEDTVTVVNKPWWRETVNYNSLCDGCPSLTVTPTETTYYTASTLNGCFPPSSACTPQLAYSPTIVEITFAVVVDDNCYGIFDNYPWLNNIVDENDLYVLEFNMGTYTYIYVKTDEDNGSIYLNNGELYCTDGNNLDCLSAYGLNESDGTVLYSNGELPPTDPPNPLIFDDYPWLNSLVDVEDCCANKKILNFPMGDYSFIYIKADDECGGLGSLYLNNGDLYCNDAVNFDCLGAYGFSESNGETLWNCGTPIDPPNNPVPIDDYPWLSSIVNAEDCCANNNISYYKKDNLTHGYIYIMAGDCQDDNYGRLYNEQGQLYCTSTASINCFEHYDLGNSFTETLLWSCDGTNNRPNQSTDDGTSRLISENISLGLNVFPNPSSGLINIEINTDKDNEYEGEQFITVYDINGRIVHQNIFDTANVKLFQADLSDLTDGIYIVEYQNANVSNAKRIMIRH